MENLTKKHFIIIAVLATLMLLFLLISSFLENNKKAQTLKSDQAVEKIVEETNNQVGGTIVETGYDISYEYGKNRVIITITDSPFLNNLEKATNNLKLKGFDFCSEDFLVLTSGGTSKPAGWDESSLCKK